MPPRVEDERDFFRRLLELYEVPDLRATIGDALGIVVETTQSKLGYVEIYEDRNGSPAWSVGRGLADDRRSDIRKFISRGIVSAALARGEVIHLASAIADSEFSDQESVRTGQIQAVYCSPIGGDAALGVLYLESRTEQGCYGESVVELLQTFTRHLGAVVRRLLDDERVRRRTDHTESVRARVRVEALVGRSAALARVLEEIAMVAPRHTTALVLGPTGTGKSLVARVIHENSRRRDGPFVAVNCGGLSESLIERELFGSRTGGYTGARNAPGRVDTARGGTLFLDEVGDLPLSAQASLLQLLQEGVYDPVGAPHGLKADIRVIAATNADLEQRVRDQRFRQDLFFRLNVYPIYLPPLSERVEDIVPLAQAILRKKAAEEGLSPLPITAGAMMALEFAEWSGNVRELEHVMTRGLLRASESGAAEIEAHHLFRSPSSVSHGVVSWHDATRRFQKTFLQSSYEATEGNVSALSKRLQIARSHVYSLLRIHGITRS